MGKASGSLCVSLVASALTRAWVGSLRKRQENWRCCRSFARPAHPDVYALSGSIAGQRMRLRTREGGKQASSACTPVMCAIGRCVLRRPSSAAGNSHRGRSGCSPARSSCLMGLSAARAFAANKVAWIWRRVPRAPGASSVRWEGAILIRTQTRHLVDSLGIDTAATWVRRGALTRRAYENATGSERSHAERRGENAFPYRSRTGTSTSEYRELPGLAATSRASRVMI